MGGGPPGFKQGFTCPALLGILLELFRISPTGLSPSMEDLSADPSAIPYSLVLESRNPLRQAGGFGLFRFRSPLLTESLSFLFLRLLRCFTSPGLALKPYEFRLQCPPIKVDGFPHSEISGSKRVCRSPKLIAAYHVLLRLLMPRHPLCALSNLTNKIGLAFT